MKLLELHIRNIASIEKADIDFEKQDGLMDQDTGRPAQKFLIFGDTGTGKSVLLDAISMALYRTTPRISEVADSQKNRFRNNTGQEISLTYIEQYTRLGITEKDECYSEVVFEDSRGNKYRAKLELGYTISRTKELKYKKKWLFWDEKTEWTEIKQDRENMIAEIIGMTFSQFNRMAMLAQGQFAQFLCGKRDQRADILEKLTNTSIFSKYGAAISSIYKRKSDAAKAAKQHLATVEQFVMKPELVEQLNAQIAADCESEKNALEQIKKLNDKHSLLKRVVEASETMAHASEKLAELQNEIETEGFKQKQALCRDWDQTDNERRALENMQSSKAQLKQAESMKKELNERFKILYTALEAYHRQIAENEIRHGEEKVWIDTRADRSQMYSDSKLICEKLSQYMTGLKKLYELRKELNERIKSFETLEKELTAANKSKEEAVKAVADCQSAIDELIKQRDALDPQATETRIGELQGLIHASEKLKDDNNKLSDKQKEYEVLAEELEKLDGSVQDAKNERDRLAKDNEATRERYEKALARLTTIKSSLSDTLNDLRKKMVDEHAEICPLCGQRISDQILTNEQFSNLISPFDKDENDAKTAFNHSQELLTKAEKKHSELLSSKSEKMKTQDAVAKEIEKIKTDLEPRLRKAGEYFADSIEIPSSDFNSLFFALNNDFLDKQKRKAEVELQTLEVRNSNVKKIRSDIDKKQEEKKGLDKKKDCALTSYQLSKTNFEKNNDNINQLRDKIAECERGTTELMQGIDAAISVWYPDWTDRVDDTKKQLQTEAEDYTLRKRKHEEEEVKINAAKEKAAGMDSICKRIADVQTIEFTDGLLMADDANMSCTLADWNSLSEQYSSVTATIDGCIKNIDKNKKLIDSWIERTDGSVEILENLLRRKDEVQPARQYISNHDANIKTWAKSRDDASEKIRQGRETLQLADDEEMPPLSETEELLKKTEEEQRSTHDRITEARSKLDANEEKLKAQEEALSTLQAAEKMSEHWEALNKTFGGERFRNLVQTHILRPLLQNANVYLHQITDRYTLTCDDENEQLSVFVLDAYNRDEVRSVTVLSGGEKFMISLALSLALSSLNRPDMNMNILFIDEGFGTLDQEYLDSVMKTLGRLSELADQRERRVGIISHREELLGCIPNKIKLVSTGEGRSRVDVVYEP